jgi:predicted nucleic acid-binding protein
VAIVVLDASVVIAFLDGSDSHHEAAVVALTRAEAENLVLPASAYAEMLVGPARRGSAALTAARQFVLDLALRIEPTTDRVAERAAILRAFHHSLRLPDALVLATADMLDASRVLTADRSWSRISRRVRVI